VAGGRRRDLVAAERWGEADETVPTSTILEVTALVSPQARTRHATRLRLVSVFRWGWTLILVALLDQAPLLLGRFVPEPWPAVSVQRRRHPPCPSGGCPRPHEVAGRRRPRDLYEGDNMGVSIITTLKKLTLERGSIWGDSPSHRTDPVILKRGSNPIFPRKRPQSD
jgi:hypothetical protein